MMSYLPPLAMAAAYAKTDVIIYIRSNHYYSAEYPVHPTILPQSEYEANIRSSHTQNVKNWLKPGFCQMGHNCDGYIYL